MKYFLCFTPSFNQNCDITWNIPWESGLFFSVIFFVSFCKDHSITFNENDLKQNSLNHYNSMVSCQKGPTRHAYAWQIGPFRQDTLELIPMAWYVRTSASGAMVLKQFWHYKEFTAVSQLTIAVLTREYSGKGNSILWHLIPLLRASTSHKQPCYWMCRFTAR